MFPKGARRLRLFPLPFGRVRRRDFPCVKAINFNRKIKPEHAHRWIPSGNKPPLRHRRDSPVCRAVHPPMCPAQRQFRVA